MTEPGTWYGPSNFMGKTFERRQTIPRKSESVQKKQKMDGLFEKEELVKQIDVGATETQ